MNIYSQIEHTCLDPQASKDRIAKMHEEALEFGFRGICVSPYFVKSASRKAEDHNYKVITVIDFPFGQNHPMSKVESIKRAADQGADGVDIVINYLAAINEDWSVFKDEVETVVYAGQMRNLEVKLILEAGAYNSKTLQNVINVCVEAKPDFLKSNTGIGGNVCSAPQIKLMQRMSQEQIPIKASGGVRLKEQAEELLQMGVDVIGTSSATTW